jgi:CheY-like chemotaxis protein
MRRPKAKGRLNRAKRARGASAFGTLDAVNDVSPHSASVLLVEDDRDIREAVSAVLEAEGYVVLTAENGCEALKVLERGRPCVVLLDLMMPVMDGWGFMNEVKKTRGLDDLPVVVVSAYSELKAEGVRRVLKKPLDVNQLLLAVADYCCCPPKAAVVQH